MGMNYTVVIERTALKALEKIDAPQRAKIESKIDGLATDPRPHGAVKLSGLDAYRIRVGNYRVVYEVSDSVRIVRVTNIGHRRSIYREV